MPDPDAQSSDPRTLFDEHVRYVLAGDLDGMVRNTDTDDAGEPVNVVTSENAGGRLITDGRVPRDGKIAVYYAMGDRLEG